MVGGNSPPSLFTQSGPLSVASHPSESERVLYISPKNINWIKSAIVISKDTERKVVLLEVIPGFKAALTNFGSLHSFSILLSIIYDIVIDLPHLSVFLLGG